MRIPTLHILTGLVALVLFCGCDPTRRIPEGKYLLDQNRVLVEGGRVPASELQPIIKQRPNKEVLWMRLYLWLHNIPDPEAVARKRERKDARRDRKNAERLAKGKEPKAYRRTTGQWLREVVGEPPVLLDSSQIHRSEQQMELYLRKEGYFHAVVADTVIIKDKVLQKRPSAVVEYHVKPGPVYRYRHITFTVDDPLIEHYVREDWPNSLIRNGRRFDADELDQERTRISDHLRELGYLFFSRDLVRYDADTTVGDKQVDIILRLERTHARDKHLRGTPEGTIYTIKDIILSTAQGFRGGQQVVPDTARSQGYTFTYEGRAPDHKPQALLNAVFLHPDQRFRQSNADRTYRRLTGLRVFDRVEITYDTTGTGAPGLANVNIGLLPGREQSVSTEGFMTNRGGFLGTSVSLGYRHRNLFRSMGLLTGQISLGLEAQQSFTGQGAASEEQTTTQLGRDALFNTIDIGPEISLRFPQFLIPFVPREAFSRSAVPRTAITTLYNYQQRPDFTRTLAKMSFGYEWTESRIRTFGIYPLEVNVIRIPRKSADFQRYLLQANDPVLTDSYTDHLIAGMRGLMTINTQERGIPRNVFYSRTMVEWAYGVPFHLGVQERVDTAGNRFFTFAGIRYAEYVKVDQEFRWRHTIHERSSMAFRLGGGIGVPYGNLGVLPFESSFFVGGANGLRAWRARSVGPGSFSSPVLAFDRIGEIRLEGNAEYRFGLIGFLEGALFADVGNIWNIREDPRKPGSGFSEEFLSELAVGTGFGARFNFDFFLIRFDIGLQTKDPALPRGERWLFQPKDRYLQRLTDQNAEVIQYRPQFNFNLGIGYPF